MKLSARTRYATRILMELAGSSDKPVPAMRISANTGISVQFVEQILKGLKQAGLTYSMRGANGGHLLAKAAKDISLCEVVDFMEGGIYLTLCSSEENAVCSRRDICPTRSTWMKISKVLERELEAINLSELLLNYKQQNSHAHMLKNSEMAFCHSPVPIQKADPSRRRKKIL